MWNVLLVPGVYSNNPGGSRYVWYSYTSKYSVYQCIYIHPLTFFKKMLSRSGLRASLIQHQTFLLHLWSMVEKLSSSIKPFVESLIFGKKASRKTRKTCKTSFWLPKLRFESPEFWIPVIIDYLWRQNETSCPKYPTPYYKYRVLLYFTSVLGLEVVLVCLLLFAVVLCSWRRNVRSAPQPLPSDNHPQQLGWPTAAR